MSPLIPSHLIWLTSNLRYKSDNSSGFRSVSGSVSGFTWKRTAPETRRRRKTRHSLQTWIFQDNMGTELSLSKSSRHKISGSGWVRSTNCTVKHSIEVLGWICEKSLMGISALKYCNNSSTTYSSAEMLILTHHGGTWPCSCAYDQSMRCLMGDRVARVTVLRYQFSPSLMKNLSTPYRVYPHSLLSIMILNSSCQPRSNLQRAPGQGTAL